MSKFFRSIIDFFLKLRDKIEEKLPERFLTHHGKVRRLVLIEEKREKQLEIKKKKENIKKTFNSKSFDLISSSENGNLERPTSEMY